MPVTTEDIARRLYGLTKDPAGPPPYYLGVPLPRLRSLARELAPQAIDWRGFDPRRHFDLTLLYGLILGYQKTPISEKWAAFDVYFESAEHWGYVDSVAVTLKQVPIDEVLYAIRRYSQSPFPYKRRFAFVLALIYVKDIVDLDELFALIDLDEKHYHVYMAIAWFLAECYIKRRREMIAFMERAPLAPWIRAKTVSKIRDSFRVAANDKEWALRWRPEKGSDHE